MITGTGGATADSFEGTPVVTAINGAAFTAGSPIAITGGTITVATNGQVTFAPSANFNGPTGFSYTVTSGGVTETATVNIGVTPVNDPPVNTVPGAQTTPEDTALPISGVSVADVDGDPLTTTLTITNGTAAVTAGGGVTISGNGTSTITLSGTAAQINAALTGLSYTNTPDYNGLAQITVATNDGTVTTTDTIGITVTPVADITNDTITTNEDTSATFNVITGTGGATADSFEGHTGGDGDQWCGIHRREPDRDYRRDDYGRDQWTGDVYAERELQWTDELQLHGDFRRSDGDSDGEHRSHAGQRRAGEHGAGSTNDAGRHGLANLWGKCRRCRWRPADNDADDHQRDGECDRPAVERRSAATERTS